MLWSSRSRSCIGQNVLAGKPRERHALTVASDDPHQRANLRVPPTASMASFDVEIWRIRTIYSTLC
jgi:hypothetical protein